MCTSDQTGPNRILNMQSGLMTALSDQLAGRIPLRRADGAKNAKYEQGRLVLPEVQALLPYEGN